MYINGFTIYDVEATWDAFKHYLCLPYKNNPQHLGEIINWYDDLHYRNRNHKAIYLDLVETRNVITDKTFQAFRLNDYMFISHDIDVLTLPYPRAPGERWQNYPSDKYVGVYLHDFGSDDKFFAECKSRLAHIPDDHEKEYKVSSLDAEFGAYPRLITDELDLRLRNPSLPGGKANHPSYWELRLGYSSLGWHKDEYGGSIPRTKWTRVIVHPLFGCGTAYAVTGRIVPRFDRSDDNPPARWAITCPIGATSSHLSIYGTRYYRHSAYHAVYKTPGGRGVLIRPDNETFNNWERYPYQGTPHEAELIMLSSLNKPAPSVAPV